MTARSTATGSSSTDGQQGIETTARGIRIDGVQGALEPGLDEIDDDLVPDPTGLPPGPDDCDRTGFEEPGHRSHDGEPVTLVSGGDGRWRWRDVHDDVDLPGGVAHAGREADMTEDVAHGSVLRQGHGNEAPDAVGEGKRGQVLEQQGRDPEPLEGVVDHEGDLGLVLAGLPVVLGDRDQLSSPFGHQRHVVRLSVGDQPLHLGLAEGGVGCEEPQPDTLGRETAVQGHDRRPVVGLHEADPGGRPVTQQHVEVPSGRSHGRVGSLSHPPTMPRSRLAL